MNNNSEPKRITRGFLRQIDFVECNTHTVMNSMSYDLGRNRSLSIGCVGSPNEILFIEEFDSALLISDAICLHNYDYDGFITEVKIKSIITAITGRVF